MARLQCTPDACRSYQNDLIWVMFYCQCVHLSLIIWWAYKCTEADKALPVGWRAAAPIAASVDQLDSTSSTRHTTHEDNDGSETQPISHPVNHHADKSDEETSRRSARTTIDDQNDYDIRSLASSVSSGPKKDQSELVETITRAIANTESIIADLKRTSTELQQAVTKAVVDVLVQQSIGARLCDRCSTQLKTLSPNYLVNLTIYRTLLCALQYYIGTLFAKIVRETGNAILPAALVLIFATLDTLAGSEMLDDLWRYEKCRSAQDSKPAWIDFVLSKNKLARFALVIPWYQLLMAIMNAGSEC